jgi:hypothetical protein
MVSFRNFSPPLTWIRLVIKPNSCLYFSSLPVVKSETILISPLISSDGVSQQNIPTEDWFCYIILGLKQISPTFSNQLETLIFPASAQLNNSSFGSRLFKFIPPKTNPENQAITLEKIITLNN